MARQITYTRDDAFTLWVGLEEYASPKTSWGSMLRLSDTLREHAKITTTEEGQSVQFPSAMTVQQERDELDYALKICEFYEGKGCGATLARRVISIRSKIEAIIKKMDADKDKVGKKRKKRA